jgi:hypothetical protein
MSGMGEEDGEVQMRRPKHEICLLRYAGEIWAQLPAVSPIGE